jgi:pyroglutamyl-peptidase
MARMVRSRTAAGQRRQAAAPAASGAAGTLGTMRQDPPIPIRAAARAPILLTGFEPFGGEVVNPSWQVARALDGRTVGGVPVVACELPCVFGAALRVLDEALAAHAPVLVLALGQAAGRSAFTPERVAINVDDARIPDNAGAQPVDRPVVPGGPAAYFTTLPVKAMVAALRAAGLPAQVSQTAGTFVCNHVFYGLMHRLARPTGGGSLPTAARGDFVSTAARDGFMSTAARGGFMPTAARGGFMHLPLLPEQAARQPGASHPSLPLATQVQAVELVLAAALRHGDDLVQSGGAEA